MKTLILLLGLITITQMAFGQSPEKIQKDALQIGRASSLLPKELIFDAGEGALNKKLSLDPSDNEFDLNSTLNILGNLDATGTATFDGVTTLGSSLSVESTSTHKTGITLGNGTNASRQITVDRAGFDPYLKWNEASGKWVFSQDGSAEKNFGSGSGGEGGIDLLLNPSFEDGIAVDWVSSGGTFTAQTYTNPEPSGNNQIYARFVATTSGQYFESVLKTIPDSLVGGCLAKINYNTVDSANWKIQIYDGSSNLLKEETLYAKNWQNGYASFPCPSVGSQIKMRIISLGAGQIEADKAYKGSENRTFQVNKNALIGQTIFDTNCSMQRGTNGTYSDFPADATCTITTTGRALAPTTNIPAIRFSTLKKGMYQLVISGGISCGLDAAGDCRGTLRISDGGSIISQEFLTTETIQTAVTGGDESTGTNYTFTLNIPSDVNNIQLNLQGRTTLGNQIFNYSGDSLAKTSISLFAIATDSETALIPEAQDWFIDANIGGGNPSLGVVGVSSYTELTNASLDMVLNTGSTSAKIPCSSTNPSSGLTCSAGNEGLGIVFTNPVPGLYEACAYFSHTLTVSGVGGLNADFQLVQTSNNSQTIIQEGKTRTESSGNSNFSGSFPHTNCGTFLFTDVSEKTIRLMYEQTVAGTISQSQIFADRQATNGQRDFHIVVRPLLSAFNRPYLTGNQMESPGLDDTKECKFAMGGAAGSLLSPTSCTTSPCTTYLDSCQALTSTFTRSVAGDYSATSTGWAPLAPVACSAQAPGGTTAWPVMVFAADGSGNLTIRARHGIPSGTLSDSAVMFKCSGQR